MGFFITMCSNICVTLAALHSSYKLFKNHRAPSVGFFMLGLSSALSTLASFSSFFNSLPKEQLSWASEVLVLTLLAFEFLWLSEDHNTAYILLFGSCLLVALRDWLSGDAFSLMTHCLCLSALSCCLTVCLFTGNALGAVAGLALALPLSMATTAAAERLLEWILRGASCVGCWASTQALGIFLIEVTDRSFIPAASVCVIKSPAGPVDFIGLSSIQISAVIYRLGPVPRPFMSH